jgi:hypothetical protein
VRRSQNQPLAFLQCLFIFRSLLFGTRYMSCSSWRFAVLREILAMGFLLSVSTLGGILKMISTLLMVTRLSSCHENEAK